MGWVTLKDDEGVLHHALLDDGDARGGGTTPSATATLQTNRQSRPERSQKLDRPRSDAEGRLANVI